MLRPRSLLTLVLCAFACAATTEAAAAATLLRLFLNQGGTVVSYGEYARVGDRVVFSMPIGGTEDQPHLQVVTLPAASIDWARTERYASSARRQWYATSRGEEDFERLSTGVARVLSEIAVSTDRRRALEIAQTARRTLAEWPAAHFGYRHLDVQEITSLLDEAISDLRASLGDAQFELALVATAADVPLEPLLGMPSPREQLDQLLQVATLSERAERVALLRSAVELLVRGGNWIPQKEAEAIRRSALEHIRGEAEIDARYAALARRFMTTASRAASRGRIEEIERVLDRIAVEDGRLGARRPDEVQALRSSVQAQLESARRFRLLQDRYAIRRGLYRDYQRSVGVQMLQLAKVRSALEAIRRLDGPSPDTLEGLRARLFGGADRLQRIGAGVPEDLRPAHGLLVSAWRFAETAVSARYTAVTSANVARAWEASSAAAAAMLLLSRAQTEIRAFVEPPRFQ
jgi:hypothetical protein